MPLQLVDLPSIPMPSVPSLPGLPSIPNPFVPGSLPSLPFPVPNVNQLTQPIKDVIGAIALAGMAPVATSILASYLAYLESQANNKLKSIPSELQAWLTSHYNVNLSAVRYAENIDTVHGQGITVGNHIYFTQAVNLNNDRSDINWLFHELEHCVQYKAMGGPGPFFAKYALQSAQSIIEKKTLNIHQLHDAIGLERDAINKQIAMDALFPWSVGSPPIIIPPAPPIVPITPPQTLTYTITVKTRAGTPSGTGSKIYVILIGTRATSKAIRVPPDGPLGLRITPGSSISMSGAITGLGDLKYITLLSDGTGPVSPNWHCESVNVQTNSGQQWHASVNTVLGGGNPLSVTVAV
jgi:hypothetical protein